MLERYPSRSGSVSARYGDKRLHSSVDPVREADRYVEHELPSVPATVIVIGPALGYAIASLRRRRPDCRVIALYLSAECHDGATVTAAQCWHPGLATPVGRFLSAALEETDTASLAVLEWPPAVQSFPEEARAVRAAVSAVIRRFQASLLTEGANGRRWLSNLVRNFLAATRPVQPLGSTGRTVSACVIAAAGPSLEASLDLIAPLRNRIALWATGSALDAVLARGLEPDLVITTDAAFYAAEYVREALAGPLRCVIAAPLTSARGIVDRGPVWLLSQGDAAEALLLRDTALPVTQTPAHGSVAGTAIQLALATRQWPVVMAGLDLAWLDVRSHARPHLSQRYRDWSCSRLNPPLTAAYAQSRRLDPAASGWRVSPSLSIYAEWFSDAAAQFAGRVARLRSPAPAPGIPELAPDHFQRLRPLFREPAFEPQRWPAAAERAEMARRALAACADALAEAERLQPGDDLNDLQRFLLRRLAVSPLLRWRRSGKGTDLLEAVGSAREEVAALTGSLP